MIGNRSNTKNVVIVIFVILTLAFAGLSAYLMFFKEKEQDKTNDCIEEAKVDNKDKEEKEQGKIEIYGRKTDNGVYIVCTHKSESDDCKDVLYTIKTKSSTPSVIRTFLSSEHSFQYIIYYDEGVKLYNIKDGSTVELKVDLNDNIEWLPEGFISNGENGAFYFDLKDNKKKFDKYDEIYPIEDVHDTSYIDNLKYLYAKKGSSTTVIDFKTGNVIITIDNKDYEGISFIKDGSYIIATLNKTEDSEKVIYNTKGEKKVELKDNQTYEIQGSKLITYENTQKKLKEY